MTATLLLIACQRDVVEPAPLQPLELENAARAELRAAVAGRRARGVEDDILRLEASVPGLGGISIDPVSNRVIVYQKAAASLGPTSGALRRSRFPGSMHPELRRRMRSPGGIEVRRGEFTFSELVAFTRALSSRGNLPGVFGYDADERTNHVRLLVERNADSRAILAAVAATGVPVSAVTLEPSGRLRFNSTLQDRMRPARAGVQIINGSATGHCSMGFVVRNQATNDIGFLTASHCAEGLRGGGAEGGHFHQNETQGNNHIGNVEINKPWNLTASECGGFQLCTDADVMFVKADSPANDVRMSIAITTDWNQHVNTNTRGDITLTGQEWWAPQKLWFFPYAGMTVYKSGRTTGITGGTISGTCVDVEDTSSKLICMMEVSGASVGDGDSGGPVFYPAAGGDPPWAIGIESSALQNDQPFQGICESNCKFFFTPWSSIETRLDATFATTNGFYDAWVEGPSEITGLEFSCTWTASTNVPSPQYTWKIDSQEVGTGQVLHYAGRSSFTLELWVTNSNNQNAFTLFDVVADESNTACTP